MHSIIIVTGILMIAATLMSLLSGPAWWIRIFDFPRVQIAVISAIVLVFYLLSLNSLSLAAIVLIVILAGCIAYQTYYIYSYTPIASVQVLESQCKTSDKHFSLLIANVQMDNHKVDGLLRSIQQSRPDLILCVETNQWWLKQLAPLKNRYSHIVSYPLDNTYGMLLYSRFELIEPEVKFLIQHDVPSIHARFALPSGVEIELHGLHPRPPSPTEHYRSTERDAEILLVAREVENNRCPTIIAGDLNDVAWSKTNLLFQRISGLLDPRIGRGIFGTFHARYPLFRWPLDHVFISSELRLVEMKTLPYIGSDHLPVFITLSYEPDVAENQDEPKDASNEDRQKAQNKITKAKVGQN